MPRKNIFAMMTEMFDISVELKRMYQLFEKRGIVKECARLYGVHPYTLREYIKYKGFSTWSNRDRCVDLDDFLSLWNYNRLWDSAKTDAQDLFTLIEIIYNFWHIADQKTESSYGNDDYARDFGLLKTIMDNCLAHYNYKGVYFPDLEQLIVTEDKPEATAVAEIVEKEIACKVLRYNHYMLKGDLEAKKEILLSIGADLEPKRAQIKAVDKELEDGIFYMLNNLHLRHNNKTEGDNNYRPAVAEMDDATLESWYDELYQMILLAYLQMDQIERKAKIKELKQVVTPK